MGMVQCPQCRKSVPVSQVQYTSPDSFVCKECATPVSEKQVESRAEDFDVSPTRKQVLVCDDCGFRNKVRKDAESVSCSYCGGSSVHADGSQAAELIAEADTVSTDK